MAEKVTVKAEKREQSGKGFARRLRQEGKVPVAVYGGGLEPLAVAAELKDLAAILRSDSGQNTVFSLDIAGFGASDVIFHDRQIDPIRGRLMHADLRRLTKGEKIEVTVALHFIGEPIGVKEDGGVLDQSLREIKILCETASIPEYFEVNVENLGVGESVHVSDIQVGEGIEVHEAPETVVASVVVIKEEDTEQPMPEAAEPEVIGKGKEDGEEETPGE